MDGGNVDDLGGAHIRVVVNIKGFIALLDIAGLYHSEDECVRRWFVGRGRIAGEVDDKNMEKLSIESSWVEDDFAPGVTSVLVHKKLVLTGMT